LFSTGSLYKSAQGESNDHVTEDVTRLMTSWWRHNL